MRDKLSRPCLPLTRGKPGAIDAAQMGWRVAWESKKADLSATRYAVATQDAETSDLRTRRFGQPVYVSSDHRCSEKPSRDMGEIQRSARGRKVSDKVLLGYDPPISSFRHVLMNRPARLRGPRVRSLSASVYADPTELDENASRRGARPARMSKR